MNPNWDPLIKAIVPLSVMAIWALTSLFNRDSNPKSTITPTRQPNAGGVNRSKPGDPTLRWGSQTGANPAGTATPQRKPARLSNEDDIVILSSSTTPRDRPKPGRTSITGGGRRPAKGKPITPDRRSDLEPPRKMLAGVSQNVNQHMTNSTIEMTPLVGMPPMAEMSHLGLSGTPSEPTDFGTESPKSFAATAFSDPARLREVFMLNEILLPPVSKRSHRSGGRPG